MPAADPRHVFGQASEAEAERFLRAKGFRILERNLRTGLGELDLVAEDRGVLVFVEVKARMSEAFGGALSAIDARKRAKLIKLASQYLAQRHLTDRPCRFDVVVVQGGASAAPQVHHVESAFDAGDERQP